MTAKKPATLRILEGNRGHRPINTNELVGVGVPKPPAHFTLEQLACWRTVTASLPPGSLTRADEQVLERMAVAWACHREASAAIEDTGPLVRGQRGEQVKNPLLTVLRMASGEMHRCGMLLGLSPLARTRLTGAATDDDASTF